MNKDTQTGVALGLNIAIEQLVKKLSSTLHAEVIAKHDLLPALSDDIEAVTELLERQREIIQAIGETPVATPYKQSTEMEHAETKDVED